MADKQLTETTWSVMNGTAVLTFDKKKNTSHLTINEGYLPLRSMNVGD